MRNIKDIRKIVDDSMELTFDSLRFIELEILFRLAERIGIMNDVNKLYTILSRGDVIYERNFSNDNFLIANAKVILKTMSHAKVYHDAVKEYEMQMNRAYAMYVIDGECLKRNPDIPVVYRDRINDYDALLNEVETETKSKKERANVRDTYFAKSSIGNDVRIMFEPIKAKKKVFGIKQRKTGAIEVAMEEIMKAADKLDQIEGTSYRRKTLEGNIFESSTGKKVKAQKYKIDGVVNMAGQVAAGKSTFADALSVLLMDGGYRIVMILSTVDSVIKKPDY